MKKIPVKLSVLELIQKSNFSSLCRLKALLNSYSKKDLAMSEIDQSTLLEALSCSMALNVLFDEFFEQAFEASVDSLHLREDEFANIIQMAKIVERSNSTLFGFTGTWTH